MEKQTQPELSRTAAASEAGSRPAYSGYSGREDAATFAGGLFEYWRIVRRRRGTLIVISFLGALAALLLTLPQTPVYQATVSLEIQGLNQDFLNMRAVNPTAEAGTAYSSEYDIQTQIRVLRSRVLIERVFRKLDLAHRTVPLESSRLAAWRRVFGAPGAAPALDPGAAADRLEVRGQPNTRLIEVSYDSADSRLAADFVNTLAAEYIEQNLETRWKTAQNTGEWLTRQMGDVRIKLEKSEEQLQAYAAATGLVFTDEKDNVAEERLRQFQEELSKAQADRVAKQSRHEQASGVAAESLGEVLGDASLQESQAKLTDLRRELAELNATYTPAHPRVKRVEAQIAVLDASLEKERADLLHRVRTEFETAGRREELLAREYGAQSRLVAEQAASVAHYNLLKREVDTNRQLYDSMLQRVKEAGVASALRASNIRVVDPARPPDRPYKPNPVQNTLFGLAGGALFGIAFIVLRERADVTIQEPGDAALCAGLPELGLIPSAAADPSQRRRLLHIAGRDASAREGLELIAWNRKPSAMAEAFRSALASMLCGVREHERPRVIVLSSPAPKEGKTTVASNLAIALADIGRRVLLIDADLRKPHLHHVFDVDNELGLADVLRRKEPVEVPLTGLLRVTRIPGLSLLPSGRAHPSETSLLYSKRFVELLDFARSEFDTVLIDTPPMLTMADARVTARLADGVILVVRANRTSRDSVQTACGRFLEDGSRVLGAIVNDWDPRRTGRISRYGYYDRYKEYDERAATR